MKRRPYGIRARATSLPYPWISTFFKGERTVDFDPIHQVVIPLGWAYALRTWRASMLEAQTKGRTWCRATLDNHIPGWLGEECFEAGRRVRGVIGRTLYLPIVAEPK